MHKGYLCSSACHLALVVKMKSSIRPGVLDIEDVGSGGEGEVATTGSEVVERAVEDAVVEVVDKRGRSLLPMTSVILMPCYH